MPYRALLPSPFLLHIFLVCCMDRCKTSNATAPVVTTSFGKLLGTATAKGRSFYGVPYAKSPTGNRRFVDPEAWDEQYHGGSRDATAPGAICISNSQKSGAEDCLFANFFTPANTGPQSRLPVLGGANPNRNPNANSNPKPNPISPSCPSFHTRRLLCHWRGLSV